MDKQGPNGICVLEPILDAKPKADKPIRAVGLKEEAMREEKNRFKKRDRFCPGNPIGSTRGFLCQSLAQKKSDSALIIGT